MVLVPYLLLSCSWLCMFPWLWVERCQWEDLLWMLLLLKARHLGEVVKAGLIKCWGTLATLPQQIPSDNSFPIADLSGADKVTDFCISCQKLANASLILPQRRWFSPARATAPPIGFCRVWEISSAVQLIACTPLYLPPTKKELFQIIPMHMITREIIPGRKTEGSTVSSINCGRSSLI